MIKSERPVRVIIADSQFLITESLKYILIDEGCFTSAKVVTDRNEIIKELNDEGESLLIIDPYLVDFNSISDLREIRREFSELKLLILTGSVSKTELYDLNDMGINNIILKTADRAEILEAINASLTGKKYYSDEILELLFESNNKSGTVEATAQLTPSEMEIVRLISEGFTTKEIAVRKFISYHTVISHRKNIFRKLGVSSISELIMYALKSGWINLIEYHI